MTIASRIFEVLSRTGGKRNGSAGPSLDTLLDRFDKELENFSTLIPPALESKPRTPFDGSLPRSEMSVANMTIRQFLGVLPIMGPLIWHMHRSARLYDGKFRPTRAQADPAFLADLEALAKAAGARDIKYVRVPPNAIFKNMGLPHEYAVVISVEMDKDQLADAPGYAAFREVAKGYQNLAVIGNRMAAFMRKNGFAAYPGTALGGLTDYVHLAELAGMGAIGYHGLLITPEEGARLRINTIYTNITNLPIENENEHLWVRDFCAMCQKCIRACPVDAIFNQPVPRGDGGYQCIDHNACRDYFNQNFGCAICLVECPFSEAGYHKVQARFRGNPAAPQFRIPPIPLESIFLNTPEQG